MWCSTSHVPIHIENEWSYQLINIYQHYGIWDEHIWCSMNDLSYLVNHNVLSSFIDPYTPWKRMIIAVVHFLSIACYIRLCPVCLYEWSRLSCQSYASWPILHVNTPGSTFINDMLHQMYVFDACVKDATCLFSLPPMSLYNLKTNDLNKWPAFTNSMLYVMHIVGVCISDLTSIVFHRCVILLHMSLYTLETNDLTYWSTFINIMVY